MKAQFLIDKVSLSAFSNVFCLVPKGSRCCRGLRSAVHQNDDGDCAVLGVSLLHKVLLGGVNVHGAARFLYELRQQEDRRAAASASIYLDLVVEEHFALLGLTTDCGLLSASHSTVLIDARTTSARNSTPLSCIFNPRASNHPTSVSLVAC